MANYPNAIRKVVLNGSRGTWRAVYYNPRNNRQVAVIYSVIPGPTFRISVPVEGKNGWHIECDTAQQAQSIAHLECTKRGKLLNRLVIIPFAFLRGKFS
jgi:hypothetical protein